MFTYFIRHTDYVKIGKTRNVPRRLTQFQEATPIKLEMLLVVAGDREKEFHRLLRLHRFSGEWFHLTAEVQAFIVELRSESVEYLAVTTRRVTPRQVKPRQARPRTVVGAWSPRVQARLREERRRRQVGKTEG
jgi:hypothetical protein